MTRNNWLVGLGVIVVIAAAVVISNQSSSPTPATTTTTSTTTTSTTTTTLPAAMADPCAVLDHALTGSTVHLDAVTSGCDAHPEAVDVTVTGAWAGDLRCHLCDGWHFTALAVSTGSLRMIGGAGWRVDDSLFDGGARANNESLGVGSTDESGTGDDQPHDWTIDAVTARNTGCKPAGQTNSNQSHSLYVIGKNGVPMHGTISGSWFIGDGCGAAVKIGGTGKFGSSTSSPDAADQVVFSGNEVTNPSGTIQSDGVLVATNSDDVTLSGNTVTVAGAAFTPSGPFSGVRLRITDNTVTAAKFVQALVWTFPALAVLGQGGTTFVSVVAPTGSCPASVGTCSGNHAP